MDAKRAATVATSHDAAGDHRLLPAGIGSIAIHQAQEAPVARDASTRRLLGLPGRGATATPAGRLVPLARHGRVAPASETAPLNLGGGALLLALGVAWLRPRAGRGDAR